MAETVLLAYPAVSKDTVMVTSMKADFFEKKVGVPGVALDIPVCTKAELSPVFDYIICSRFYIFGIEIGIF